MNRNIILASSSPRRIEMLEKHGIKPLVIAPEVEESLPQGLDMIQSVMYLSLKKALSVELSLEQEKNIDSAHDYSIIIAADTIVYLDRIIGKPNDYNEAYEILMKLRGKRHYVVTGVALLKMGSPERTVIYDITDVYFKNYEEKDVIDYIQTEEPYDKAGGYAIQGSWGQYVDHIHGSLNNVIGFPWERVRLELIRNFQVETN